MRSLQRQRGIGIFGLLFILILIGIVAMLLIKSVPIYLNQMTIERDLHDVANKVNSSGSEIDPTDVHRSIEKRWDIDYVTQVEAKDIKVARDTQGNWAISYDYEAREHLFSNVFIVIHFADSLPLRSTQAG